MKNLKFEFTIEETNLILEALGGMPFKQVFGLIQKIQNQAGSQLSGNHDSNSSERTDASDPIPQIQKPK